MEPQVVMVEGEAVPLDSIRQPEKQNGALHPDTLRPMTPDGEQPRRQPNGILEEFPVIAGAGKAFVAGADISFFVRNIEAGTIGNIVAFTEAGQKLLVSEL